MSFPTTRSSAVVAVRSADRAERARGFDTLVAAYWRPVYKYLRLKWNCSNEDAQDFTQGFFARALEKDFFAGYDVGKGSFRTFLRTCLDGFVSNERKAARRQKRGGDVTLIPFDFDSAVTLAFTGSPTLAFLASSDFVNSASKNGLDGTSAALL